MITGDHQTNGDACITQLSLIIPPRHEPGKAFDYMLETADLSTHLEIFICEALALPAGEPPWGRELVFLDACAQVGCARPTTPCSVPDDESRGAVKRAHYN